MWKVGIERSRSRGNHSRYGNLVSGHTRMALGNTRMRWSGTRMRGSGTRMRWLGREGIGAGTRHTHVLRVAVSGTRMGRGHTRMDEKDDDFNVVLSLLVRVWESVLIVLACWAFRFEMSGRGRDDAAIAEALGMLAGVLGGNPNVVGLGVARQLSEFQKNNPLMFKGAYDPDGAQKWLKEIERIF
ncbi:hypothetical protein KIW84_058378 [Lathyrus oleraceus]|uniref:Uncharacterized protein n=1 Tax=Pisum sativum TaxID=3888 RepID=A0A9D4X630_PEA|nr:hypothetical protein KIW84_058378 [Pisum sativum]